MIMADFDNETVAGFPMNIYIRMLVNGNYFVVFMNKMTGRSGSGSFIVK
jgi:hypothetical protein